jgi:hypothetical protein
MARRQSSLQPAREAFLTYRLEYVTGVLSLYKGDGLVVNVINDGHAYQSIIAIIYSNLPGGPYIEYDSGHVNLPGDWTWGLGFPAPEDGHYWLRVQATSEWLIPQATFERYSYSEGMWIPIVSYRPGDFAVFALLPERHRIW